jgi:threonyl-tRNA synthetase
MEGEAVFYGPKIDVQVFDAIGRKWQCSTIQFDFTLPQRFDASYIGDDSSEHRVIMVHRALMGSAERFFGMLVEHYAGAFPLWLAPVQAIVIPIADRHIEYAERIAAQARERGMRVEVDARSGKMGAKIRDAQMQKIPFMLVVGDREADAGRVAVRHRAAGDLGPMEPADFFERVEADVRRRAVAEWPVADDGSQD